jgi:hypothetical protein
MEQVDESTAALHKSRTLRCKLREDVVTQAAVHCPRQSECCDDSAWARARRLSEGGGGEAWRSETVAV